MLSSKIFHVDLIIGTVFMEFLDGILEYCVVLFFIVIISIVQSIFGVGLLLLGTPMLILFGFDYQHALVCLLPASIIINIFQIYENGDYKFSNMPLFLFNAVPFVAIGSILYFYKIFTIKFGVIIGLALIFSALIRLSENLKLGIAKLINNRERESIALIGLFHGYTNMGGSLLTIWASFKAESKIRIRGLIAQGYLVFALTQFTALIMLSDLHFSKYILLIPFVSTISFLIFGRISFEYLNERFYNSILSLTMIIMGIILLFK